MDGAKKMTKPMTPDEARQLALVLGYGDACEVAQRDAMRICHFYADMLDRQTPDVSGLVEALEAFAAMRPDSAVASENLGTMRLTWEADTDLFTAPIEMTKRARQALSTFKRGPNDQTG